MSDSHLHHQLSPQSIRFCPLCGGALERRRVPPVGKQEMVCAGCSFIFYLNHKVVAATIPEHEGRVLLTRRTIQPARGKWTVPGGFVDWGEPVEDGALRETWEETGLKVDLACYKFEVPEGFRAADVLMKAQLLRVERGDHHIAEEHLADAIALLLGTRQRLPT